LTQAALESILTSVTRARDVIGETRAMQTVVSVLSPQEQLSSLPSGVTREIIRMRFVLRHIFSVSLILNPLQISRRYFC